MVTFKSVLKTASIVLGVVILAGFIIDTGSVAPPHDAVVYFDSVENIYYPPTRAPREASVIPISYGAVKALGAKPDDSAGFNVDGPPLIAELLASYGVISPWKHYWQGTSVAIERYRESN